MFEINYVDLYNSLGLMWRGMLGIFAVMVLLALIVKVFIKLSK